jgi:hypothetical protein
LDASTFAEVRPGLNLPRFPCSEGQERITHDSSLQCCWRTDNEDDRTIAWSRRRVFLQNIIMLTTMMNRRFLQEYHPCIAFVL